LISIVWKKKMSPVPLNESRHLETNTKTKCYHKMSLPPVTGSMKLKLIIQVTGRWDYKIKDISVRNKNIKQEYNCNPRDRYAFTCLSPGPSGTNIIIGSIAGAILLAAIVLGGTGWGFK